MIKACLGIDLGGSKIYSVVLGPEGNILLEDKMKSDARKGYKDLIGRIGTQIDNIQEQLKQEKAELHSIGLCVPGVVTRKKIVQVAPNLGWHNANPTKDLVFKNRDKIRLVLSNDVNAALMGELTQYDPIPSHVAAYFCGTGVGGAIAIDGKLVIGFHGGSGEVGHIVVRAGGRKAKGGIKGSVESYIGKRTLGGKIQKMIGSGKETLLTKLIDYDLKKEPLKSSSIKKAYKKKDPFTLDLMNEYYCKYLGIALSQSANFLDPELIILGGGFMEALGKELLPRIMKNLSHYCIGNVPIVALARLGDRAGAIGAAHLASKTTES